MVHRTDFTSPYGPFGKAVNQTGLRFARLLEAVLIIGFAGVALLLCVAVGLGLWDIVLALLP